MRDRGEKHWAKKGAEKASHVRREIALALFVTASSMKFAGEEIGSDVK